MGGPVDSENLQQEDLADATRDVEARDLGQWFASAAYRNSGTTMATRVADHICDFDFLSHTVKRPSLVDMKLRADLHCSHCLPARSKEQTAYAADKNGAGDDLLSGDDICPPVQIEDVPLPRCVIPEADALGDALGNPSPPRRGRRGRGSASAVRKV
eukprot:g2063.t1